MLSINEIIDISILQEMQDNFASAFEMAFVTVDYKGIPVTTQSGFTEFCSLGRMDPEFKELCYQCDAHGGLHGAITGKPHIYKCHANLTDFSVPIIYEGNYYGAMMGGQIQSKFKDGNEKKIDKIINKSTSWQDNDQLKKAYDKVKLISHKKIESATALILISIQSLLKQGHMENLTQELNQKYTELLEEKNKRMELEKDLLQRKRLKLPDIDSDSLFSTLNLISRLAFIENAKNTEEAIYILSNIMRYRIYKDSNELTTIGEELDYIQDYIKIQKIRIGQRLQFKIDIPEQLREIKTIYMLLQPIVDTVIDNLLELGLNQINIFFDVSLSQGSVLLKIDTNLPFEEEEIYNKEIIKLNNNLTEVFGKKYGIIAKSEDQGKKTILEIKLSPKNRH